MTEENCCERHVDGKVTLYIEAGGGPIVVNSVYDHRPRDYYESIRCPSCRFEQQHRDQLIRSLHTEKAKKSLTTKERLQKKLKERQATKD